MNKTRPNEFGSMTARYGHEHEVQQRAMRNINSIMKHMTTLSKIDQSYIDPKQLTLHMLSNQ